MGIKKLVPLGFTCVLWASLSTASTAITIRHDRPDSAYTNLGTAYESVAALQITSAEGIFGCSGTKLRGVNFIATAAHCLDGATSIDVSFGNQMTDFFRNDSAVGAESWRLYDDWEPNNLLNGGDLALIKLPENGNYPNGFELYRDQTTDSLVGLNVDMVGFGRTGNGLSGEGPIDGNKRRATNLLDGLWNEYYQATDFTYPFFGTIGFDLLGSREVTRNEGGICFGDSGGGAFLEGRLAGIHSFIISRGTVSCDYIDAFGHLRVSKYADWIDLAIASWGNVSANNSTGSSANLTNLNLPGLLIFPKARLEDSANIPEPSSIISLTVIGAWLAIRYLSSSSKSEAR